MFEKIARFSVRFRWFIIILWLAAVPILTANLPKLSDVTKNDNSQFLPKNSQTEKASELEADFENKDTATRSVLVISRGNGKLTAADGAATGDILSRIRSVKGVSEIQDVGLSRDGMAHQYFIGLSDKAVGPDALSVVSDIRSQMKTADSGLDVHLAGELAQEVDSQNSNNKGKNNTEVYNVVFIIVLLLLVFRAALAPLITLVPAGLALAVAQPIIAQSTKIGVQVSFITEILLIVLLLGAGTDYGLFLVFRTREELRNGLQPKEAVIKALSRVGESITFSAVTVAAALMCLLLASFGVYKGLGPALAIGLGVMLIAGLTFLPALLAIFGRAVFWPSRTLNVRNKVGLWGRVADHVIDRPKTMIVCGVALFLALSLGVIGYRTAGFAGSGPPLGSDSAQGDAVLAKHFPAANNNPQFLLMRFNQPVWHDLEKISQAEAYLDRSDSFKAISGPFDLNGTKLTPAQLRASRLSGGKGPISVAERQFISQDGRTVQFYSIANTGPSGSVQAADFTPHVQATLSRAGLIAGAAQTQVYGQDAASYDISRIANDDLKKIIPVVLLAIGILLAIMLRSLVAPLYLILTVGLSYLAALGFAMFVFVHLKGEDGLNFILPFMMFVFAMALGQDYNILVMSRIREEATRKDVSLKQAVTKAIGITGTTVTSAGLILAGTFTVFGLVAGDIQFEEIGFSIAFGILLDTFFVRTLLVPSIVVILGRWNWWPSKLSRINR